MGAIENLPPAEKATVEKNQRSDQDLPTYFSSTLKIPTKISRDFEAFLILAPSELKTSAMGWIDQAVKITTPNKLRDALNLTSIANEKTNSQLKIDALSKTLVDFNNFRKNFQTDTTFATVPEVQAFLSDLQRVIDELIVKQKRAIFDNTIATLIQRTQPTFDVTTDDLQQLQSWTAVLSDYLNTTEG